MVIRLCSFAAKGSFSQGAPATALLLSFFAYTAQPLHHQSKEQSRCEFAIGAGCRNKSLVNAKVPHKQAFRERKVADIVLPKRKVGFSLFDKPPLHGAWAIKATQHQGRGVLFRDLWQTQGVVGGEKSSSKHEAKLNGC